MPLNHVSVTLGNFHPQLPLSRIDGEADHLALEIVVGIPALPFALVEDLLSEVKVRVVQLRSVDHKMALGAVCGTERQRCDMVWYGVVRWATVRYSKVW
jgi:hypothetical protein